jgi:hypothetical protein
MSELGFERAQAAETGRPGYDPRDLLKLYLYGYLNQTPEVAQSIRQARNRLLPEGRKCSGQHERSGQQRGHIHMEAPISKTVRDRWRVQVCSCTLSNHLVHRFRSLPDVAATESWLAMAELICENRPVEEDARAFPSQYPLLP